MNQCKFCRSSLIRFLTDVGDGCGKYKCDECEAYFVEGSPFVSITDDEAAILSELAFAMRNEELEQELSERRDFAEGRAKQFRELTALALETSAAERHFDYTEVKALYERLTELIYPESATD